jgi:hypothetical protein
MKNILLLLLLPCIATAQRTVATDTSYVINVGGIFYRVDAQTFTDAGPGTQSVTLLGDTTAVLNNRADAMNTQAAQIASALNAAVQARLFTVQQAKLDTTTIAQIGRSPISTIMARAETEFLTGEWEIVVNGTATNVTFPRLSSNQRIRLLPQGSTARTLLIYGPLLRIINYPTPSQLNIFFQVREGLWEEATSRLTTGRATILRRKNTR